MSYAGAFFGCGCSRGTTMSDKRELIDYKRCAQHYDPARDDPLILEAARNRMALEGRLIEPRPVFSKAGK